MGVAIEQDKLKDLAHKFVREAFPAYYELEMPDLSEWLAEASPVYADLFEDEQIDDTLDAFADEVHRVVTDVVEKA